ncbi:MAG: glycosyltransferase [Lachnospiraceae bacterium]|nr:glycosyltransferase [Lachnospiraceae bacterium]
MPDVLWLHNLHGYYINIEMLFEWIKKHPELEVKWTLHDCWSFTGHCSHFTYAQCNKWKKQCFECEQKGRYPKSVFMDNSVMNFQRKQKAFCGVRNLTIVVPCKWLASMVKESFLKEYPVEVSYNSINTNIFKPTVSDFREKNGLEDKIVILGVANVWDDRKGIQDILKLASMLDNRYAIVLVGLSSKQVKQITKWNESTQKSTSIKSSHLEFSRNKDEKKLSGGVAIKPDVDAMYKAITGLDTVPKPNAAVSVSHIICMQRTTNAEELAAMYTMADYFVNPTYEDTYPTVNLEAKACGTYVITYDVGGAAETLERGLKNENYI